MMPSVTARYEIGADQKEGRVRFVNPLRSSEEILMKQMVTQLREGVVKKPDVILRGHSWIWWSLCRSRT